MFSKNCLICNEPHNNEKYCSIKCRNKSVAKQKHGTVLTKKTRQKIAKSMQGKNQGSANPFYGKKHPQKMRKFIGDCQRGEKHHAYTDKNTIFKTNGYLKIHIREEHPFLRKGRMPYHRFVMANYLGRKLRKEEIVHHKDRNPLNNDISNLTLFKNSSAHTGYHNKFNRVAAKIFGTLEAKEPIRLYHLIKRTAIND